MSVSNPFAPAEAPIAAPVVDARFEQIGRLVVRWERLRWLYNAILVPWTLLSALPFSFRPLLDVDFWDLAIAGALFSNACFCCGPLIDGYLTWFFRSHPAVTAILFASGALFTMLLSTMTVVVFSL